MPGLTAVGGAAPNIVAPPATIQTFGMSSVYGVFHNGMFGWAPRLLRAWGPSSYIGSGSTNQVLVIPVIGQWGAYDIDPFPGNGNVYYGWRLSSGQEQSAVAHFPVFEDVVHGDLSSRPAAAIGPYPVPPDPSQVDLFEHEVWRRHISWVPAVASPRGLSGRLKMRLRRLVR